MELDKEKNRENGLKLLPVEGYKIKNPILRCLFPHLVDTHNLIVKVVEFKERDIGIDLDGHKHQTIDAYQYAFRRLMAEQPNMFIEVEKYYATARFFRSMTVVFFMGSIIWLIWHTNKIFAVWIFLFSIISLFVFLNRWRKANHVAFKNIIILEGTKKKES